ncbi:hypothetical protein [Paenarthrobacter sp. PH39-S1]|uniref:hypothetical protein n=1 Tax=Paenarthrobacter sp. PH39-S1 TaxID=3046204 RepID=UPI0024BA47C7|nr:hypothetical protein [Paenarthrobacter sp. PH39-S1]MDJ0355213.1 hypothetical protein [Paenarthrobacter sp. PH39-S1]
MLSTISSSGIRSAMATSALIMSSAGCSHISTRKLLDPVVDSISRVSRNERRIRATSSWRAAGTLPVHSQLAG